MNKLFVIAFFLACVMGCTHRVGPFVRDARMEQGRLVLTRCDVVYSTINAELRQENCAER